MSHSTCMIVLRREPKDADDLDVMLAEALAPFDENTEVDPYKQRIAAAPEGWEVGVANTQRFQDLLASGIDRQVAWKQVWGDENTDPRLAWPRSIAAKAGVDPTDDAAVVAHYQAEFPDSEDAYLVDDEGLFEWSTYNPQSRWDWWSLGGRWMGYFQVRQGAPHYLGRPGVGDNEAPTARGTTPADACRRGDIDVDGMTLARAAEAAGWWDEAHKRWPDDSRARAFMSDVQPGEGREDFIVRKAEPAALLRPFAVLAEGCWREAGRMGWFGVDSSTDDSRETYAEWFARFWAAMPDDTWLAVVDVHI